MSNCKICNDSTVTKDGDELENENFSPLVSPCLHLFHSACIYSYFLTSQQKNFSLNKKPHVEFRAKCPLVSCDRFYSFKECKIPRIVKSNEIKNFKICRGERESSSESRRTSETESRDDLWKKIERVEESVREILCKLDKNQMKMEEEMCRMKKTIEGLEAKIESVLLLLGPRDKGSECKCTVVSTSIMHLLFKQVEKEVNLKKSLSSESLASNFMSCSSSFKEILSESVISPGTKTEGEREKTGHDLNKEEGRKIDEIDGEKIKLRLKTVKKIKPRSRGSFLSYFHKN